MSDPGIPAVRKRMCHPPPQPLPPQGQTMESIHKAGEVLCDLDCYLNAIRGAS